MLAQIRNPALRDVLLTVIWTGLFLVATTVAWLVADLVGTPQTGLGTQLLFWGLAALVGREPVQRLIGGGSVHRRGGLRFALSGAVVWCAIATTGLPYLFPVVGGAISATIAQRSPGRRSSVSGVLVIVVGTGLMQVGVSRGLVPLAMPAGPATLTAVALMFMTVVSFLHTEAIAAHSAQTSRALIAEQQLRHAELLHAAHHDSLTGLPTRRTMNQVLDAALLRARPGAGTAVLYLDLDGFKAVNDTLGHDAGDALLVAASLRMSGALRQGDVLARTGGDEFVAVLQDLVDEDAGAVVADRVRAAMASPVEVCGQRVVVGVSVGIAHTETPLSSEDVLRTADAAMYLEKRHHRVALPRDVSRAPPLGEGGAPSRGAKLPSGPGRATAGLPLPRPEDAAPGTRLGPWSSQTIGPTS